MKRQCPEIREKEAQAMALKHQCPDIREGEAQAMALKRQCPEVRAQAMALKRQYIYSYQTSLQRTGYACALRALVYNVMLLAKYKYDICVYLHVVYKQMSCIEVMLREPSSTSSFNCERFCSTDRRWLCNT